MKSKIIYWLKFVRNIFDTTIILMLLCAIVRTILKVKYQIERPSYLPPGNSSGVYYTFMSPELWYLNTAIHFKRSKPEIIMSSRYVWQYYFEIVLFSLPTLFFVGLEFYKRRILIFKKVDEMKEKRLRNKNARIKDKIQQLNQKLDRE